MVALPPPRPCLRGEQLRRSKKRVFIGVPAVRQEAYTSRIFLRPRSSQTQLAKLLRELGRLCSTPAAPHEAARLHQRVSLRLCVLSQRHCRVPDALGAGQLRLRCSVARIPATRFTAPLPSVSHEKMRARQRRFQVFPALVPCHPIPGAAKRRPAVALVPSHEG